MATEKSEEEKLHDSLRRLLLRMFSAEELRRFVRFMPGGQEMIHELPGPTATPSETVAAIVVALLRHEAITKDFFDRLVEERPRRADEIRKIQRDFIPAADGDAGDNIVPIARGRS